MHSCLSVVWLIGLWTVSADAPCPAAEALPLLTIDKIADPAVPVVDTWQVTFQGVPISDAQIAALGQSDPLVDLTREEMTRRGMWVYIGMATAAGGTALSSVGWVLFGKESDDVPDALALSMAIGGILIGGAGTLLVTESIQSPLEPHLAPTPRHRLTREQVRQLVAATNRRLYVSICRAAENAGRSAAGRAPDAASNAEAEAEQAGAAEGEATKVESLEPEDE